MTPTQPHHLTLHSFCLMNQQVRTKEVTCPKHWSRETSEIASKLSASFQRTLIFRIKRCWLILLADYCVGFSAQKRDPKASLGWTGNRKYKFMKNQEVI